MTRDNMRGFPWRSRLRRPPREAGGRKVPRRLRVRRAVRRPRLFSGILEKLNLKDIDTGDLLLLLLIFLLFRESEDEELLIALGLLLIL